MNVSDTSAGREDWGYCSDQQSQWKPRHVFISFQHQRLWSGVKWHPRQTHKNGIWQVFHQITKSNPIVDSDFANKHPSHRVVFKICLRFSPANQRTLSNCDEVANSAARAAVSRFSDNNKSLVLSKHMWPLWCEVMMSAVPAGDDCECLRGSIGNVAGAMCTSKCCQKISYEGFSGGGVTLNVQ